jgi:hypothetical protein
MARRVCTTVAGDSVCCQAAQQGLLGRPITFTTRSGSRRCGVCNVRASVSTDPRKRGKPVFQFRFASNQACGIVSGCSALQGQGMAGAVPTSIPPPLLGGGQGLLGGGMLQIPGR